MSTGTSSKRRLFRLAQPERSPKDAPRRFGWTWPIVGTVLLVIWIVPMLVAHSPIVGWALSSATVDLDGTLRVRSVSLGWLSPICVSGVELRDASDQVVLEIPKAEGNRSLLGILLDSSSLGRFRLDQPKLTLVLRPDGSNLEDLVAKVRSEREGVVDLGVDVVDAKVAVLDTAAQRSWEIDKLRLALSLPADQQKPWEVKASGNVTDPAGSGDFQFAAKMRQSGYQKAEDSPPPNELSLSTNRVPIELFQSPLRRLSAQDIHLAGQLGAAVTCTWDAEAVKDSLSIQGNAAVEHLRLAAPALGSEPVQFTRIRADGQVAMQGGSLNIQQLTATTDVGNAALSGVLDLRDTSVSELMARLPRQTYQLEGHVDLAHLAAALPGLLRLQEGTQITSGRVQWKLASRPGPEGMLWEGRLESSSLEAVSGGRRLIWENPIQLTLAARDTPDGPVVEALNCHSSFLKLNGSGTAERLNATASFDLARLASELGNFFDLGRLRLAGDGWAKLNWSQLADRDFTADAQLQFHRFECTLPERPTWKEDNLTIAMASTGRTDFGEKTRIDSASLVLESGTDRLDVRLLEPVAEFQSGAALPIEIRAQGRLEQWRPRLAPWVNTDGWNLAGSQQLSAQLRGSLDEVQLDQFHWRVEQLMFLCPQVQIHEPQAELVLAGVWNGSQRRVEVERATLTSPSISARVDNAVIALPATQPLELSGELQFQCALDRLQQWLAAGSNELPAWRFSGHLSAKADLRRAGATTAGRVDAAVSDLVVAHESGRRIQQPSVRLVAQGTVDDRTGTIQLDEAELTAAAAGVAGTGTVAFGDRPIRLDLDGRLNYDLDQLTGLLQMVTGPAVRLSGRGTSPFAFHGPLDMALAEASAALNWTDADVYGFRIGAGEIDASLAGGLLGFKPVNLDVSEGKLRLLPSIQFAPGSSILTVEPGRVADRVRINPAMCANGLQYIAPALAGVASAEGRFSIELDRCRVPLEDLKRGQVQGRMVVHDVQVGAGPLVQELAVALGYQGPAQIRRESTIDFQLVDRRVYHRGAELAFPDLTVRTYGSVGVEDRSLAMVAEMPIPPKWLGNNLLGTALKNQLIQLPIAGTLDRPKLDRTALDQASRQFLQNATQNLLQNQLNRLLGPPQPVR